MKPIRPLYEEYGSDGYYRQFGAKYRNPHEPIIGRCLQDAVGRWSLDLTHVLDLACGSGEATLALQQLGATTCIGIDPYTSDAYQARTGTPAHSYSFTDITNGALNPTQFSLIVCSFALHLEEPSRLHALCYQLTQHAPALLVLTPHKKPHLKPEWGWILQDETLLERVRTRYYRTKA